VTFARPCRPTHANPQSAIGNLRSLACALLLCAAASSAAAHPAPFSYLDLRIDDSGLHGMLVVHDFDASYELGLDAPEALLDAAVARTHHAQLTAILNGRLTLLRDGRPAAVRWAGVEILPDRESLALLFRVDGAGAARLTVEARLFPYDPLHQTFVNVYADGELSHQAILDSRRDRMEYYAGTMQGRLSVLGVFLPAGIEHILIGPDHVLFLLALLLLGGSLWRLAAIVTSFTIGHSVTLSLAALGKVSLPAALVEPLIALSIIVVGADNLLVHREVAQRPADRVRDLRPYVAGLFGLIHGFGFAYVLQEFGLPAGAIGWSLLGFNLGVEVGQLAIVIVAAAALAIVRRNRPPLADRIVVWGSILVMLAGGYWFVDRVFLGGA
jgi:hydrogenase/urease accessory protein HupE